MPKTGWNDLIGKIPVRKLPSFLQESGGIGDINAHIADSSIHLNGEAVQDVVGALLVEGSNISLNYDDGSNTLTISATGDGLTQEEVEDIVGNLITEGTGITVNYDDGANTLTLSIDFTEFTLDDVQEGTTNKHFTDTEKTKLSGIEENAKDDQSASEVPFTPDGDISASDVQNAIQEVRDDTDTKLNGKSDTTHSHFPLDISLTQDYSLIGNGSNVASELKNNLSASAAPTVNDDSDDGYSLFSFWLDIANSKAYICLDATVGAAVWVEITAVGLQNVVEDTTPQAGGDFGMNGFDLTDITKLIFGDGDSYFNEYSDDRLSLVLGGNAALQIQMAGTAPLFYFKDGSLREIKEILAYDDRLSIIADELRIGGTDNARVNLAPANTTTPALSIKQASGGISQLVRVRDSSHSVTMGFTLYGLSRVAPSNGVYRFDLEVEMPPVSSDGDGVGQNFRTENASGVLTDIAHIDAVFVDISEDDADLIFSTRNSSAPSEKARITSLGDMFIQHGYRGQALSADPADPPNGEYIIWMSDGTGTGSEGDLLMKWTSGAGVTTTVTINVT